MASVQDTNTESSHATPERESQTLEKTVEKEPLPTSGSQGGSEEHEKAREKIEKTLGESKQGQEQQKGEQNAPTQNDDSSKLETKEAEAPNPLQSQGSSPETQSTKPTSNMQSLETPEKNSQQESSTLTASASVESHAAKETAKDSHTQTRSQGSSHSTQVTSNEAHTENTSEPAAQSATLKEPPQSQILESEPTTAVSPEKAAPTNRTDKSQAVGQQASGSHPQNVEQQPQQAQQAHGDQQPQQQHAQPQHQQTPPKMQLVQQQQPQGQHQPVNVQQQQQTETTEQEYVRLPGQATGHIVKKQRGRFKLLQEAPPPAAETQTTTGAPPSANIPPASRERASSNASSKSNVSATANAQTFDGSGAPVVKRKGRFMVTNVTDPGLVAVPVQAVMTPVTTQPMDPSQASISGDTDGQPIAYGTQMMMVTPAAQLSMPQQVQYTGAPQQEGNNPAAVTLTFQQTAVAVQPPAVVGSAGPLPTIPAETVLDPAALPAAGDDPQAKAKPKGQPRKPTPQPNAARASGGLAGQTGLGKVFYFLDQMRLEVTEADKTIKTLQSDMKFLKEKNKELEAKAREAERKLHDEKCLREAAESKVRALKKRLRHMKGESASLEPEIKDETPCDEQTKGIHSRSNSVANADIETLEDSALSGNGPSRGSVESRPSLNSGDLRTSLTSSSENVVDPAKVAGGSESVATSTSPSKPVAPASASRKPQATRSGETATTPPRESLVKNTAAQTATMTSSFPSQMSAVKRVTSSSSTASKTISGDSAVTPIKAVQRNSSSKSLPPLNVGQGASATANCSPPSASETDLSAMNALVPQQNPMIRSQSVMIAPPPQSPMPGARPVRESSSSHMSHQRSSTTDFDPLYIVEQAQRREGSQASIESSLPTVPPTPLFVMDQPAMAVPIVGMAPSNMEGSDLMSFGAHQVAEVSSQNPMSNSAHCQDLQQVSAPESFQNIQQPVLLVSQQQFAGLQDLNHSHMMTMQQPVVQFQSTNEQSQSHSNSWNQQQQPPQPPGGSTASHQNARDQAASGSTQSHSASWIPQKQPADSQPSKTSQQQGVQNEPLSKQNQWSQSQPQPLPLQSVSGAQQGAQNQNANPQHQWPQSQPAGNPNPHGQNQGTSEATQTSNNTWNMQQQWAQQHSAANTQHNVQNQGLRRPTQSQSNWNSQQHQRAASGVQSDWFNSQQQQQRPPQQQPALNGKSDWLSTQPNAGAPLHQPAKDATSSDPFQEMARRSRPPQAHK